jgi:hypothetical protein
MNHSRSGSPVSTASCSSCHDRAHDVVRYPVDEHATTTRGTARTGDDEIGPLTLERERHTPSERLRVGERGSGSNRRNQVQPGGTRCLRNGDQARCDEMLAQDQGDPAAIEDRRVLAWIEIEDEHGRLAESVDRRRQGMELQGATIRRPEESVDIVDHAITLPAAALPTDFDGRHP